MYHEDTHRALWNMPVEGEPECGCSDCEPGHCKTKFQRSVKMGTYQPTFIIHDMDHVQDIFVRSGLVSKNKKFLDTKNLRFQIFVNRGEMALNYQ